MAVTDITLQSRGPAERETGQISFHFIAWRLSFKFQSSIIPCFPQQLLLFCIIISSYILSYGFRKKFRALFVFTICHALVHVTVTPATHWSCGCNCPGTHPWSIILGFTQKHWLIQLQGQMQTQHKGGTTLAIFFMHSNYPREPHVP